MRKSRRRRQATCRETGKNVSIAARSPARSASIGKNGACFGENPSVPIVLGHARQAACVCILISRRCMARELERSTGSMTHPEDDYELRATLPEARRQHG